MNSVRRSIHHVINWRERINWYGDEEREALADMFLSESERFYRRKEIDTRKLHVRVLLDRPQGGGPQGEQCP